MRVGQALQVDGLFGDGLVDDVLLCGGDVWRKTYVGDLG